MCFILIPKHHKDSHKKTRQKVTEKKAVGITCENGTNILNNILPNIFQLLLRGSLPLPIREWKWKKISMEITTQGGKRKRYLLTPFQTNYSTYSIPHSFQTNKILLILDNQERRTIPLWDDGTSWKHQHCDLWFKTVKIKGGFNAWKAETGISFPLQTIWFTQNIDRRSN